MIPTLLIAIAAAVVRSVMVLRLERWPIGAPLLMLAAGVVAGWNVEASVEAALNTEAAQHVAEIILAVLLFTDATEIRGGRLWGRSPGLVARLLLVAMPLSLVACMGLGALLFPALSWAVLLVLACVVVPIDFAPNDRVVRDRRLPSRLRNALNIEGGYNDGILSPIFLFGLTLAGASGAAAGPLAALGTAVPHALKAIGVGLVVGALFGWLLDRSAAAGWSTDQTRRVVVVLAPLGAYTGAVAISGNGFVAAFVAGIGFRYVHRTLIARRLRRSADRRPANSHGVLTADFTLLEDLTVLMTMAMWFMVGVAGVILVDVVDWRTLLFCLLALTVLRVVPVVIALSGSALSRPERVLAGLLGPRGTTTIVFGLLAFNGLPEGDPADTILIVALLCVVASAALHGSGSSVVTRLWERWQVGRTPTAAGSSAVDEEKAGVER